MSVEAVFEDQELRDFLANISARSKSVVGVRREYAGLLGVLVFQDVLHHFEQEQGSAGPWKPWSEIYSKMMRSRGFGGSRILQISGRLRQNFKPTDYKTTSQGVYWFNDAKTKGGFPYAFAHDEGVGRLPQRDFMWLSDKAMERIEETTIQFMLEKGI